MKMLRLLFHMKSSEDFNKSHFSDRTTDFIAFSRKTGLRFCLTEVSFRRYISKQYYFLVAIYF